MSARLHLVVGGQASGKSSWAEQRILDDTPDWLSPVIICPCQPFDEGMDARIKKHREYRDPRWITVETFDIGAVFSQIDPDVPVLVDALDTWLSQRAYELGLDQVDAPNEAAGTAQIMLEAKGIAQAAKERIASTMIIAGMPGVGLVPLGKETRRLVDLHGHVTQVLRPDLVTWIHAGRVIAQG